ncbi:TetR/AcrR family transcriptional regulator [Ferruginibacter yonginensis]|uniref:TetR/AcrR family transcriptional regulator n=1 Tax=Ferruginibacter yonginensis TaxID=1310416 RepID=A0ABV8QXY4_9BACT
MQLQFNVKMNDKLFLRNPEGTEIGKLIIRQSIKMIADMGYELFTFKKLAIEINSTEATVYRYFENKHRLLIYLVDWYWAFIEFQVMYQINNLTTAEDKIKKVIDILVWEDNAATVFSELDVTSLYYIAIAEGSKTYLSKDVDVNNKDFLFKPYKDLCARVAGLFKEYNKNYKYAASLASTIIETSHQQYFFMHHLPRLCDFSKKKNPKEIEAYLEHIVFSALNVR